MCYFAKPVFSFPLALAKFLFLVLFFSLALPIEAQSISTPEQRLHFYQLVSLSHWHYKEKNYEAAKEILAELQRDFPEQAETHYFFARSQYVLDSNDELALEQLGIALEKKPELAYIWALRAEILSQQGFWRSACFDFERAAELNPYHPGYSYKLSLSYFKIGEIEKAWHESQYTLKIRPNSALAYYLQGLILHDVAQGSAQEERQADSSIKANGATREQEQTWQSLVKEAPPLYLRLNLGVMQQDASTDSKKGAQSDFFSLSQDRFEQAQYFGASGFDFILDYSYLLYQMELYTEAYELSLALASSLSNRRAPALRILRDIWVQGANLELALRSASLIIPMPNCNLKDRMRYLWILEQSHLDSAAYISKLYVNQQTRKRLLRYLESLSVSPQNIDP